MRSQQLSKFMKCAVAYAMLCLFAFLSLGALGFMRIEVSQTESAVNQSSKEYSNHIYQNEHMPIDVLKFLEEVEEETDEEEKDLKKKFTFPEYKLIEEATANCMQLVYKNSQPYSRKFRENRKSLPIIYCSLKLDC